MKKISIDEIKMRIKQRFPDEDFEILEYNGLGEPGKVKCLNCKKIIEITKFNNFLVKSKKYGCCDCRSKIKKERENKIKAIEEKYNIIKTYVKNTHTYYVVSCKNCAHVRDTTLKNLYTHLDCGCITNAKRGRTAKEFITELNSYSKNGSYTLISEYINQSTPILLRHECGFIWKVRPGDVIHGRAGCPKCARKESKGELFIKSILNNHNIPYVQEKRLEKSKMRFDFYLENEHKKIAIEYNGIQHYEEVNFFSNSLQTYQDRDKRKAKYCQENNIELYIIPYYFTKEQIISTIEKIINKFND